MLGIFVIIFLIISVIAGFSGMIYMFIFPILFIVLLVIATLTSKGNTNKKEIKLNKVIKEEDKSLEEHIMFTEMTDHLK